MKHGPTAFRRLVDQSDQDLASQAADGSNDAIATLYDRYEERLFGYCQRILRNREDAADATQEAFCSVVQRLPGLDIGTLNFAAYLYTAARNASLDVIKQSKRTEPTDELPEDPTAVVPVEIDPERALLTGDQQRAARAASDCLPERQRTVLALREVAELSYDDIAQTMEMNPNAVAQLISRARLNFFKQLRAASVVIPPLDETGKRAIELAAARQDGRIADDELTWLEQHLRENELSRVNVEAMHESTRLYRAIGPVAVVATLREATIARAADLVSQQTPLGDVAAADDKTQVLDPTASTGTQFSTTYVARTNDSAGDAQNVTVASTGGPERRRLLRRARRAGALTVTLLVVAIGTVAIGSIGGGKPTAQTAGQATFSTTTTASAIASTKTDGRAPSKKRKRSNEGDNPVVGQEQGTTIFTNESVPVKPRSEGQARRESNGEIDTLDTKPPKPAPVPEADIPTPVPVAPTPDPGISPTPPPPAPTPPTCPTRQCPKGSD